MARGDGTGPAHPGPYHTGWNQIRAAKILGINRSTLRAKLALRGIVVEGRSAKPLGDEHEPAG